MLNLPKKILVVEDDETMRLTLAALLRREGFDVRTARDGEEGYAAALASCPDLIITDLQMPVLDGVELARLIRCQRGQLSQAPILALSANLQEYHLPERMSSGINRFFDKAKQDRQTLLSAVHALLETAPREFVSII
ncbi:MAG: response regulator [Acidobacteria bacterium]|nr:response regulator [Acidobacteriota bacterium]MBI3421836.1 response regulator [Acidobacteriota bacterium]